MEVQGNHGFTLLELLTVVAIVGILTSIAVPQFAAYKKRAYDVSARSDLRNVAIAEEAYFIDSESYLTCANSGCAILPGIASLTSGVTLAIISTTTGFSGTATHNKGTGKTFIWNTSQGGMQP